ncbi:MAG: protein tlpB [Bacteroidia bacterium]
MNIKKITGIISIVLIAATFILSAYLKLEPLEPFKFVLAKQLHIKSWWLVEVLSRLIIGTELFLGISLLSFILSKKIIRYTAWFLVILSVYLIYVWIFIGEAEDCGCFGEYLHLSIKESILKNILLLALLYFAYKWSPVNIQFKYASFTVISTLILSLAFPWIFNAPDKMYENPYDNEKGKYLNVQILNKFNNGYPADSLKTGKKIVCFFSTSCKFCAYSAKKITLFQKNYHINLPVYYVFWGDDESLKRFWEKSESFRFPYQLAQPDPFFALSGNQLPAIYFLENGIVKAKHGYRTLDDQDILSFISEK